MKSLAFTAGIAAFLSLSPLASPPAMAGCIAGVCTDHGAIPYPALYDLTCGDLWYLRNSAFADNGLCFRTARGRRVFGDRACTYANPGDVPLSRAERINVSRIKEVERQRGCR